MAGYPTLQYKDKGTEKQTERVVIDLPLSTGQSLPVSGLTVQKSNSYCSETDVQALSQRVVPHMGIKGIKMGPRCLVLHLPSYAGVQEALEFLDVSMGRILHLESFL
jgi:hypothetical protein